VNASLEEFRKKIRLDDDVSGKANHKEISSEDVINLYEICFSEYGWSYEELMETPIPVFFETIEALKRRKNEEAKAIKNSGKKKRIE
jgi:hypothetical protein